MPTSRPSSLLSIGQLAQRSGLSVSAIRFYEQKGLVRSVRNSGNQRRFKRAELRRLSFVMICQRLGFTLAEIAAHLESLPLGRTPTREDWRSLAKNFDRELARRESEIQRLRQRLTGCIGCGCLSLTECSLFNAGDHLGEAGTGPRFVLDEY
jgi:MerR family redox-sensitive transcriptional activator SoxR